METTEEIPQSTERTGKDGRKLNTANIGKRPATPQSSIVEHVLADVDATHAAGPTIEKAISRLKLWLMDKGWTAGLNTISKSGMAKLAWPDDDLAAEYAALATAKNYELGDPVLASELGPQLRPLTADETMSLVWRVVKAAKLPLATTPATTGLRWQQYRDWLSRYTVVADYSHEAPAGTQIDRQTLAAARQAIITELDKNIGMVRKDAAVFAGVDMATGPDQTAVMLHLPHFPVADKDLFVGQAKRAIKLLDEEGCASVADFLRAICRSL